MYPGVFWGVVRGRRDGLDAVEVAIETDLGG